MLSSRKTRFQWSKQDRGSDVSLFRSMSQRWKPTVHHHDPDLTDAIKSPPPPTEPRPAETPGWTPWLWVD
ncbi:hypothetical protein PQJ75_24930 [Rhodoplanes sp. TEM]|uniref:Uncharacterized protein n=1 Tax=Rhodoplanes tepidamans TaxID=200616 RepID=A0ABT5JIB1_RHOTP|nr:MULTISPECIES: hypothetical protein [Rhodoplanes]MDC7789465.1 hypothetical protein [Rhodoplanes tepidamans]MDC7986988.1 hypothetical protein [Rhodoplanes sp. TEM]MDQ0359020.1 hypothetical protein [Rhodoplanes tepidamans]